MTDTAVAKVEPKKDLESVSNDIVVAEMIKDVAMMDGEVQRWSIKLPLKAVHQYGIRSGRKVNGNWIDVHRVFPTSEAYDWMNRIMGVSFDTPKWIHDETGEAKRNPIHRQDYIYLRMVGIGYNDLGQMVAHAEDVEIDYQVEWQKERLKQKSAEVVYDESGMPKITEKGVPVVKLSPEDELKAMQRLYQLRSFGPRQAQTVARTRILKLFSGIRTLYETVGPLQLAPVTVSVVGYRDKMTPDERLSQAQARAKEVFGAPIAEGEHDLADEEREIIEGDFAETEAEIEEAKPDEAAPVLEPMPGENIKGKAGKPVCGAVNPQGGIAPCTQDPANHDARIHTSENGVWPVAA
jgi:hypothetical protein